jgi:hypothetical protein
MAAGQIAPQLLALASGAIDESVDGFEPQGAQAALMAGLEPAGDLLGRPSFGEAIGVCRKFRVKAISMGMKETSYGKTETTGYFRRAA